MNLPISNRYAWANPFTLWWRSLKTRVTLFTLAIFMIGLWSLAFYASRELREDMQRVLGEEQSSTVSVIAAEVNQELDDRLRVLEKVAGRITPGMIGNSGTLQTFLEERLILQGQFNTGVIALGLDGIAIADLPRSAGRIGLNFKDRDFINGALREGKATIGRPVIDKVQRTPIFVIAVPIRDAQGKLIGALAGATSLGAPNFLDKISASRYGKTGGYLLIEPQSRLVVTATDKNRVMEALPPLGVSPWIDRVFQGYEGTDVFTNPMGVKVLTSVKAIPVAGWIMVSALPIAEAFAPIDAMQQRMLLAALFLTLLAGGLTWWMLKHQLSPMLIAVNALTAQSNTNQPMEPLPITSQDEIGELIGGFNRLLETLEQREDTLKESELRYRTVADFTLDWEYWISPDDTLRYISPSCEQISGYTADEFYADPQLTMRIIHPEDQSLFAIHSHRLSAQGVPVPIDYRILTKKGEARWISHVCRPVIDPAGKPLGQRASNRDITDRKLAEEALMRVNADLQRFAEVTAHHLQEPARRMATYAERLTEQLGERLDDAETRLSLEFIGQQARRQQNLLRDVERYLAADQPRGEVRLQNVDKTVSGILSRLAERIAEMGAEISLGHLPLACIDLPRLDDLFSVALDNALCHGRGDQPLHITIEGQRLGNRVRFSISDNGPGIKEEYREQVFLVFERLSSSHAGTGIGLAILRRIAESCGGHSWIEATPGGGCRLLFELAIGDQP